MQPALAGLPIALVLVAMLAGRLPAALAGLVGLAAALAVTPLGFDLTRGGAVGAGMALAGPLAEALSSTVTILWIILPALALYEMQLRAGALDRIRGALAALTPDRSLQVLLIAWFFGLFMEGAAGFGTPVALAAPLLVGLGLPPVRAVAVALLGHAPGVSFGAVGTPVIAQVELTGVEGARIAMATAALHVVLAAGLVLAVLRLAKAAPLGRREVGWGLAAAVCFVVPAMGLAVLAGPELPTLGGALLGGAAFVLLILRSRGRPASGPMPRLVSDLAPYAIIVALVLATRLIGPLQEQLAALRWGWTLAGGYAGGIQPLYHPGTILMLGLIGSAAATGRLALLGPSLAAALRRLAPVALALLVMLALARVMVHAGMIATLAQTATAAGGLWPLLAPAIGVLGTFVTGSATASNILFTPFQAGTAAALGLPAVAMAAAQGFGAAIGNAVAPHNIIAGSATVGLSGREGEVLRLTGLPVALYALGGGLLLLLWTLA